jgi:DNA sulfur modification protein DndB
MVTATNSKQKTANAKRRKAQPAPATPKTVQTEKQIPSYQFPCIRGIQSGVEYYTAMIPLRLLSKLFVLDSEEMPAEMRSQRKINPSRVRKVKDYVLNSQQYTLSSVTVTIDVLNSALGDNFTSVQEGSDCGILNVPMDSRFLIADGQHRIEGLKQAMLENLDLRDETISCVIFLYTGLKRAQTIFHDLNFYNVKPNKSLNLLYDHHSDEAELARQVMKSVPIFSQYTDCEKTSVGQKSAKVFTFQAIQEACQYLLVNTKLTQQQKVKTAIEFWTAVSHSIPEWNRLLSKDLAPGEMRQHFICGHAIALCAIAHLGFYLLKEKNWKARLENVHLDLVEWNKTNQIFEDKIIFGGQIRKTRSTITALGEWLWTQHQVIEEVAEGKIMDWLRLELRGMFEDEVREILNKDLQNSEIFQKCVDELSLHCSQCIFTIAWHNAIKTFKGVII